MRQGKNLECMKARIPITTNKYMCLELSGLKLCDLITRYSKSKCTNQSKRNDNHINHPLISQKLNW